ncbi:MAG: hypothetical protein WKG07_12365 [Hymenobacter sp.]
MLAVFHGLFAMANPRYADLSGRALAAVGEWLARLWPERGRWATCCSWGWATC